MTENLDDLFDGGTEPAKAEEVYDPLGVVAAFEVNQKGPQMPASGNDFDIGDPDPVEVPVAKSATESVAAHEPEPPVAIVEAGVASPSATTTLDAGTDDVDFDDAPKVSEPVPDPKAELREAIVVLEAVAKKCRDDAWNQKKFQGLLSVLGRVAGLEVTSRPFVPTPPKKK